MEVCWSLNRALLWPKLVANFQTPGGSIASMVNKIPTVV